MPRRVHRFPSQFILENRARRPIEEIVRSGSDAGLRHSALVYEFVDEYVAHALDFLREGLDAGDAVVVADTLPGLRMMQYALGTDAQDVSFYDTGSSYSRPARALAAYHGVFTKELQRAPSVRALAQAHGFPLADWDEWSAYESLTNMSYAHLPVWVMCAYDASAMPDEVLKGMWKTHSDVLTEHWCTSDVFEDPKDLVRAAMPAAQPLPGLRALGPTDNVDAFRERVARAAEDEHVPVGRVFDLLVATDELTTNALRHGHGVAQVRAGTVAGRFVCEVTDRGPGFDFTLGGYRVPGVGDGRGLWITRQLVWRLEFFDSEEGFTARVWL